MDLMKKVSGKLDKKMKDGEISREEIVKEASELMGKMKDMGGGGLDEMMKNMAGGNMGNMMKKMARSAAGGAAGGGLDEMMKNLGGEGMGDMLKQMAGSLGKNMKLDTNAIDRMTKQASLKEKVKQRAMQKREKQLEQQLADEREKRMRLEQQQQFMHSIETNSDGKSVFRMPELGKQEQSCFIHPDLLKEMEEEDNKKDKANGSGKKDKKKKKKNKK